MPKSQFYAALLRSNRSEWTPPVRPPNVPAPQVLKYDSDKTPLNGGFEIGKLAVDFATGMVKDEHATRTDKLANQVSALLPAGVSVIMVPDEPPAVGWGLSPSYSLYPQDTEFFSSNSSAIERTTINGTGLSGVLPGTAIPNFEPPPGASIAGQTVIDVNGEHIVINVPDYTARELESRGVMVKDMELGETRQIPADTRYDARDRESQRDFDVGREPGGENHFRDNQGDIRPGVEIA